LKSPIATEVGDPNPTGIGLPAASMNDPETFAALTVNVRVTGVAALKPKIAGRLAVIEQVPTLKIITSEPEFLQTAGMFDVKVTGNPELARAVTDNGEIPRI
jgi:hypothetical protein